MDIGTVTGNADFQSILNTLKGPLSFLVQLGFVIFIIVFAVQAGFAWVQYFQKPNPQEKAMAKDAAIDKLKGLAWCLVGYLGIRLVLNLFGVGGLLS